MSRTVARKTIVFIVGTIARTTVVFCPVAQITVGSLFEMFCIEYLMIKNQFTLYLLHGLLTFACINT